MQRQLVAVSLTKRGHRWHATVKARIGEGRVCLTGWEETKKELQQWVDRCLCCLGLKEAR